MMGREMMIASKPSRSIPKDSKQPLSPGNQTENKKGKKAKRRRKEQERLAEDAV
jgi:hypothetical protein